MKFVRNISKIITLIVIFSLPAQAQVDLNKVAQSTMNFLLVSISPEASAIGEANVATSTGVEAIFSNPAGIAESNKAFDARFYITQWIADIDYMAGAVTWNSGVYGSVGISFLSVDYGTINGTQLLHPSEIGSYPLGYKDTGPVDNVAAYAFGISYARAISDQFLIGGNVRLVGQNLGRNNFGSRTVDNDATKFSFDAGVKYYTGMKSFRFGMAIRNFASNIKREEIYEQLPLIFTMGGAMDIFDIIFPDHDPEMSALTLSLDFIHPNNYTERLNIGAEYKLWGQVALRTGYQTNRDLAGWSAGLGFNSMIGEYGLKFDYSYSQFDIFDDVNRFSLGFEF